jgi:hypothetical protein
MEKITQICKFQEKKKKKNLTCQTFMISLNR